MMRRWLVVLASLLLAACFTSGRRGADGAMAVYDLGPLASRPVTERRSLGLALDVRAPLWFDAQGINYRLAYAEPARLREYARARWAGPPAQLIQQRLIQDLALVPAGQSRTLCLLRLDIDEFSQVFATPTASRGVLQGRVQWLDRSRTSLAERQVKIDQLAASNDSPGGVAALAMAVGELARQIEAWQNELIAAGRLRSCRP
ncbi:MAG: hypothetical protein H6R15_2372 [Proteobacteria bacterium]|nr:hypothetical protein [Pseudomonadota bacterium]